MGTIYFPQQYTIANISKKLMDLHLEFGVYPKNSDCRTPQCLDAEKIEKLVYFQLKPRLDRSVLTSDCRSDASVGATRDELWDSNRCACHCLNIFVQATLKELTIENYLAPLMTLACGFSKNWSAWNRFKRTQMEVLNRQEEYIDDEREADFDGDEDFKVGGEGLPA